MGCHWTSTCQLTANPVSMNCHLSATGMIKTTNGVPLNCHSKANWLPIRCHLTAIWVPLECLILPMGCHWTTTCQLTANPVSMNCHWNAEDYQCSTAELPLECQLTANPVSLNCQLSATLMLKITNGVSLNFHLPIDCQSSVNELLLECYWND